MKRLIVEGSPAEWRVAMLDDAARLVDLEIVERATNRPALKEVYLGRVRRIDRTLDCAFVDLGRGEEALLRLGAKKPPAEGSAVIVEVAALAQDGKGPRVSRHIDLEALGCDWPALEARAGRLEAPALIQAADPLARAIRCRLAEVDQIILDHVGQSLPAFERPCDIWREKRPAFETLGIETEIQTLFQREVTFAQGARLSIEPTSALTAIDVNSGQSPLPRHDINLAAALEIARQIRLRNLAGKIVVDFIDGRDASRTKTLVSNLAGALSEASRQCRVAGPTQFGLVEIERQKRGAPLERNARQAAAAALREIQHRPIGPGRHLKITAGPAVHDWLKARPELLQDLGPLEIALAPGLALDQTRIEEI